MRIDLPGIRGSGDLWLKIMKIICGDTHDKSMVDLCCFHAPYTPLLGFKERTYVDVQNRPLDHEQEQKYFIQSDVFEFFVNNNGRRYSVMILSDAIEHFNKTQGFDILLSMYFLSDKQIIFTPLGEYDIVEDDNPDSHRSGWTPEMLPDYLSIVFPDFHPEINMGAWFGVNCEIQEKTRIFNEIQNLKQ